MPLTPRQQRFCEEFLVDLNQAAAARRVGVSAKRARQTASEWMAKPAIVAEVQRLRDQQRERTQVQADDVFNLWWLKATADANELIELRRVCCRYCHGDDHRYQYTPAEYETAQDAARAKQREPDPKGGVGYDRRKPPHPDCPECFGEGIERIVPKDTRHLSPAARALYAGVKTTKDGLEVKLHDADAALVNIAKHLGMFVEVHEHGGPGGGPIEVVVTRRIIRPTPPDGADQP